MLNSLVNNYQKGVLNRIQSENNQDDSLEILQKWTSSVEKSYHRIYKEFVPSVKGGPIQTNWTAERFAHYIKLKEEALQKGREIWADYVWVIFEKTASINTAHSI